MSQKNLNHKNIFVGSLVFFSFILFLCPSLKALNISPTLQVFAGDPGDKHKGEYTLTNNEEATLIVTPEVSDWFVLKGNEAFKAEDWLKVDKKPIVIEKGKVKKMPYEIRIPKGAKGELVAKLAFRFRGEEEGKLRKILSVAIYVGIDGTQILQGELVGFSVDPSTPVLSAGVIVENTGNVHLRPFGRVQLVNDKNEIQADIQIERQRPVYPGEQGGYFGSVRDFLLPVGEYTAKINLSDFDQKKPITKVEKKFLVTAERKVELK